MGMGTLRRSRSEDADDEKEVRKTGVHRLEVDSEPHHFRGDIPYSFWSASKITLLLSVLLWWLPTSAGYMVAGYVGGRRAGSPVKAVVASLIPVVFIFAVSTVYAAGYFTDQIGYVAALPASIAMTIGEAIPLLAPYTRFITEYLTTFVLALQQLFGMGSNGYLVTIAFAYIGGIVADQTRRELVAKKAGATTSVNIFHPFASHFRQPLEASDAGETRNRHGVSLRANRGRTVIAFASLNKLPADVEVRRQALPARRRTAYREEEPRLVRVKSETPAPSNRNKENSVAMQRFVERALRAYERPKHEHRQRT